MGYYDTAQICRNGHVINKFARESPQFSKKFCGTCGAATLTACEHCQAPIRGGYHHDALVLGVSKYDLPAFCDNCGAEYPWTHARIQVAKALAHEMSNLSAEEQDRLAGAVEDLVKQTPAAAVAENRFKTLLKKAGKEATDAMRSVVVDVMSEAVKKSLFP